MAWVAAAVALAWPLDATIAHASPATAQPQQAGIPAEDAGRAAASAPAAAPAVAPAEVPTPSASASAPVDAAPWTGRWVHGFAAYGAPKYPAGFTHFDYFEPTAPKGGVLRLAGPDRRSSFDKFNYWTTRGNSPAGVTIWMVESLGEKALDEPMSVYGLLAESMLVAPDFSSVTFRIRPQAKFNNGAPVLARDVKHSFDSLTSKGASPGVQSSLAGIEKAVVLDERTVRFDFRDKSRDQVFVAAGMPVFSHQWGGGKPFDQIVDDLPIFSGPYAIGRIDRPQGIEFVRRADYWGANLPNRKGRDNFDRIVYRLYGDEVVAREAFKAGNFDVFRELFSRMFVRAHRGAKWDDGRITKARLKNDYGQYMQSFQLNNRRPLFADIRVREALNWTYDFDTANKTGIFTRTESMFENSPYKAEGLPSPGEVALLEPFRAELPATVFGPAWRAPRTGADPERHRANLLKARALLQQAGWTLGPDNVLRNAKGEPFVFEYLETQTPSPAMLNWQRSLKKLGITLNVRQVDYALYTQRLQKFDFDMIMIVEGRFTLPMATDLQQMLRSSDADIPGAYNYRGVKSRAVDKLIQAMGQARTLAELKDAARALDRVITWNFWQIPDLFSPTENISYWSWLKLPAVPARFFTIEHDLNDTPWVIYAAWDGRLPNQPKAAFVPPKVP